MGTLHIHPRVRRPDPRRLLERMLLLDLVVVPAPERRDLWETFLEVRRDRETRRCA